jgi:addiction module RelE/StbE family toxin
LRRQLLYSSAFVRVAKRITKRQPRVAQALRATLAMLLEDAFQPQLKTHKLKGELDGAWACSAGYDLRIVFELVDHQNSEAILLLTIGTHDEVY